MFLRVLAVLSLFILAGCGSDSASESDFPEEEMIEAAESSVRAADENVDAMDATNIAEDASEEDIAEMYGEDYVNPTGGL